MIEEMLIVFAIIITLMLPYLIPLAAVIIHVVRNEIKYAKEEALRKEESEKTVVIRSDVYK